MPPGAPLWVSHPAPTPASGERATRLSRYPPKRALSDYQDPTERWGGPAARSWSPIPNPPICATHRDFEPLRRSSSALGACGLRELLYGLACALLLSDFVE